MVSSSGAAERVNTRRAHSQGVFMVGLVVGCGYFIFKLVRIWQQQSTKYYRLTKSMTVFDVLSLVTLMTCSVFGAIVWRDFGKGLKEAGQWSGSRRRDIAS